MGGHVCPVWVAHFLASPVRKIFQNPKKILAPYVIEGMVVLDIGCAMGFFSLPLAEMVGLNGKVICVDVQKKMIESLKKRAQKAGFSDRIEGRICDQTSLGLGDIKEQIDFALAFAVIHEITDETRFFGETCEVIKPGGRFLISEPKGHVSDRDFHNTLLSAQNEGFKVVKNHENLFSRSALLQK